MKAVWWRIVATAAITSSLRLESDNRMGQLPCSLLCYDSTRMSHVAWHWTSTAWNKNCSCVYYVHNLVTRQHEEIKPNEVKQETIIISWKGFWKGFEKARRPVKNATEPLHIIWRRIELIYTNGQTKLMKISSLADHSLDTSVHKIYPFIKLKHYRRASLFAIRTFWRHYSIKSHLKKFRNLIQLSNIMFLFPNILRNITQVSKIVAHGCHTKVRFLGLGPQTN